MGGRVKRKFFSLFPDRAVSKVPSSTPSEKGNGWERKHLDAKGLYRNDEKEEEEEEEEEE